jgi:hypothetical protein
MIDRCMYDVLAQSSARGAVGVSEVRHLCTSGWRTTPANLARISSRHALGWEGGQQPP